MCTLYHGTVPMSSRFASPALAKAFFQRAPQDKSLVNLGVWRTGFFTVPATTHPDRVQFHADDYRRKYGASLELEGFEVRYMGQPFQNQLSIHPVDADRRRYEILAWVKRRPVKMTMWIPDRAVPDMQRLGLTLKE